MRRAAVPIALVLVLAGGLVYRMWYEPTRFAVDIGAGMVAKQVCSCVFVARRSFDDCRADQFESMDPIQAEQTTDPPGVHAFVPGFGSRRAVHREGLGCSLD